MWGVFHAFQENIDKPGQNWCHDPLANFYILCQAQPEFASLLGDVQVLVLRLEQDELSNAI